MSIPVLLRCALLVVAAPVATILASPQTTPPHMEHTAPFLGRTLTIRIEGAPPLSAIDLFMSPEAGSFSTPYGVFELRRELATRLASGVTTAAGTWSFDLPVPLDEALAEAGAHFQALVDDPSAPAGKILSDAVHARFLGPRVYAGFRGNASPARAGLDIVSATTDAVVARVEYGFTTEGRGSRHEGKPVFDAAYSRGAVMSQRRELLFFDPFFGGVQGRIAFPTDCSRTLLTDLGRRTVYVLELGGPSAARVHAIDLATGSETAYLDLPNAVEPIWCAGRASSEAFIAEYEPGGRTALRWIDLDPLSDHGSAAVGKPGSNAFTHYDGFRVEPLPMFYAAGQVFVSTTGPFTTSLQGNLTRCRAGPTGIATRAMNLGFSRMYLMSAIPAADRVLAAGLRTDFGPAGGLYELPITTIGPPTGVPGHPQGGVFAHEIEPDGKIAWIIGEWEWDHADILYRLDLETGAWTQTPHFWIFGHNDAEVLRDALNHEVWVSNTGFGPPINIDPEILVLDELHGTTRRIALDRTVEVLHAVPLP
ncbi:MAG: hypothetical protein ACKVXR_10040 [Planctomycetota bacterium]